MENKKCEKCGNEYSGELAACPHCETVKPVQGGAPVENKKSGLGTASMILGIISIAIAWIPVVNYICFILGILAVVFAIICFVKKASKGKAIAGIICGGLSLLLPILYTAGFIGAANEIANELENGTIDIDYDLDDEDWDFDLDGDSTTAKVGEAFEIDDFEVTVGKDILFGTVNNQFSDYNGQTAVRIPLTIKNVGDETGYLSSIYYTAFGSKGTELETLDVYFDDNDDSMFLPGDLRPGASYTKYLNVLYDGDGTYAIEFDDWTNKVTVEFEVTK